MHGNAEADAVARAARDGGAGGARTRRPGAGSGGGASARTRAAGDTGVDAAAGSGAGGANSGARQAETGATAGGGNAGGGADSGTHPRTRQSGTGADGAHRGRSDSNSAGPRTTANSEANTTGSPDSGTNPRTRQPETRTAAGETNTAGGTHPRTRQTGTGTDTSAHRGRSDSNSAGPRTTANSEANTTGSPDNGTHPRTRQTGTGADGAHRGRSDSDSSAHAPARLGAEARRPGADVVVIGGGVIGLVTAWRAAGAGLSVAVVDPAPGGGAAGVAAGMLAPVTELHHGEEALLDLNLASARRYPAFAAELAAHAERPEAGVGYRACGTLAVALDADDRALLRESHLLQRQCGLAAEWLTGRECRRLEPMLAPGVRGGLRVDGDHQVDPRALTAALLTACRRAGVTLVRREAGALLVAGGRAAGVRLTDGDELRADQTVLAGGSRSGQLAGLPPEVAVPVRPVKGQILRLRDLPGRPPLLTRTVRAVVRGEQVYLVPRENGELVLGATSEERGWDTRVTAGGVYQLLRDAHELVPGITELPLVETRAGLRPTTPDNGPLLGPTALPGLHLATGHHRNGVLLAPITGEALAAALSGGELPEAARPFHASRFVGVAATRSGVPA